MAKAATTNGKREALARDSALNPHPEAVRDPLFADNPFFDPADLVQVRWLSGQVDQFRNLDANRLYVLEEGGKILKSDPLTPAKLKTKA